MTNQEILELLNKRDERVIREVTEKYGAYLMKIAGNILSDQADREECVNDALYRFWNGTPPERPESLSLYLASLTREICIDRYRRDHRKKRSGLTVSLSELSDVIADEKGNPEDSVGRDQLVKLINEYLSGRPIEVRRAFLMRYFYMDSIQDIAKMLGRSSAHIYTLLSRERKKLKKILELEGYEI